MNSLPKGGEIVHKVRWTLANQVIERKYDNVYLRGRVYIESVRGSLIQGEFLSFVSFLCFWAFLSSSLPFWLGLPLFLLFVGFTVFSSSRWHSYDFLGIWSSSCASWGIGFKIQTLWFLLSMDSSRGKMKNQVIDILVWYVINHWHADVWIRIWDISMVLPYYLCFVWRIAVACLMVCRWQVQHDGHRWWSRQE
jgi:hypothetical protein